MLHAPPSTIRHNLLRQAIWKAQNELFKEGKEWFAVEVFQLVKLPDFKPILDDAGADPDDVGEMPPQCAELGHLDKNGDDMKDISWKTLKVKFHHGCRS